MYYSNDKWSVVMGRRDPIDGVAWGWTDANRNKTGWNRLYVTTNSAFDEQLQAYAAGYLEGVLESFGIWAYYQNFKFRMLKGNEAWPELVKFMTAQLDWT